VILYSFGRSYLDHRTKGTKIDTENEWKIDPKNEPKPNFLVSLPQVFTNKLIYNISWEDYEVDKELLDLDASSNVLTIASAGDHVLNYVSTELSSVHGVDINLAQIALVALKKAIIKHMDYEVWWEFFGLGKSARAVSCIDQLKAHLDDRSWVFWKKNSHYFDVNGPGFYRYSTSGYLSRIILFCLKKIHLTSLIQELIAEDAEQRKEELFQLLWIQLSRHRLFQLCLHPWLQYLGGIPSTQQQKKRTLYKLIRNVFYQILVKGTFRTNPFWGLYFYGRYQDPCIPWHIREEGFYTLKQQVDRISYSQDTILDWGKKNDGYTHINLLDHQDWYASIHDPELIKTWKWLNDSESVRKIMFRSIHTKIPWLELIDEHKFRIDHIKSNDMIHDRVGTYNSTYVLHAK